MMAEVRGKDDPLSIACSLGLDDNPTEQDDPAAEAAASLDPDYLNIVSELMDSSSNIVVIKRPSWSEKVGAFVSTSSDLASNSAKEPAVILSSDRLLLDLAGLVQGLELNPDLLSPATALDPSADYQNGGQQSIASSGMGGSFDLSESSKFDERISIVGRTIADCAAAATIRARSITRESGIIMSVMSDDASPVSHQVPCITCE
jgi:hypothetical protein